MKNYTSQHGSIMTEKLYEARFPSVPHETIDDAFMANDINELVAAFKTFLREGGKEEAKGVPRCG